MLPGETLYGHLVASAITLVVVIDPIGLVPIYIANTGGLTPDQLKKVPARAVMVAAGILLFFIAVGQLIFDYLGIGLYAFRVAGGIVLLMMGLKMTLGSSVSGSTPSESQDVAVFPIGIPFIAGPGTITAAVILTDNDAYTVPERAATAGVLLGILFFVFIVLKNVAILQRLLGATGVNVVTRIMGLILAGLAVQNILNGIRGYFNIHIGT